VEEADTPREVVRPGRVPEEFSYFCFKTDPRRQQPYEHRDWRKCEEGSKDYSRHRKAEMEAASSRRTIPANHRENNRTAHQEETRIEQDKEVSNAETAGTRLNARECCPEQ
jgi:hypothetical protein